MLKLILARFKESVKEEHQDDFEKKLYTSNLERAYLVSVVGVASFFFILLADILNLSGASSDNRMINVLSLLAHVLLSFFLIPAFLIQKKEDTPDKEEGLFKNKRNLFFFTLSLLSISMLPFAINSISMRQSIIAFAVFFIVINLAFHLPHRTRLTIDGIAIILSSIGIIYVTESSEKIWNHLLEIWALMIALFIVASYQYIIQIRQFKSEKLIEEQNKIIQSQIEAKFQQQIAEVEMTALRAQMNPHFLFNVLNSIKYFIVQNDSKTASKFLTKFARLIRMILNNSKSSMITLHEELSALKLYIEMENFRFSNKFEYQINVSKKVDTNLVTIPPMILQPYVENAIWHGLMHKKDEIGKLEINIQPTQNYDGLHFIIEDNGIGRDKAQEIKTRRAVKHKSVGMQITKNRIDIANQLFDTDTSVQVIDLKDEITGAAKGTRVVVHLPLTMNAKPKQKLSSTKEI